MARIDDWQLTGPLKQLIQQLHDTPARNSDAVSEVLNGLIDRFAEASRRIEIAHWEYVIRQAEDEIRDAGERLRELRDI